jgi:hypothetical protein
MIDGGWPPCYRAGNINLLRQTKTESGLAVSGSGLPRYRQLLNKKTGRRDAAPYCIVKTKTLHSKIYVV